MKTWILYVITVLAVIAAVYAWFKPQPLPQKEYVTVEVPRDVIKIKTVEVPVEKIVVIEKDRLKTIRQLPDWVTSNDKMQITAVGLVEPYKGKTEILSIINIDTGKSQLLQKRLSLSFIQFLNEKEIGMRYGTEFVGFGRYTFFRAGDFHVAGYAQIGKETTAQVEISYRW